MANSSADAVWHAAVDELAILNLVARLAQAADDRNEAAYRACLAPWVWTDVGGERRDVPADEYVRASMTRLARAEWTHHKLANPVISIDTCGAHASALIDVVVEIAYSDADGRHRRATIGGRYDLGLVRQGDEWRIDRRIMHCRYSEGDLDVPALSHGAPDRLTQG
jgi:hypothetical protein